MNLSSMGLTLKFTEIRLENIPRSSERDFLGKDAMEACIHTGKFEDGVLTFEAAKVTFRCLSVQHVVSAMCVAFSHGYPGYEELDAIEQEIVRQRCKAYARDAVNRICDLVTQLVLSNPKKK